MKRNMYNYPVTGATRKADQADAKAVRHQIEDRHFNGPTVAQVAIDRIRNVHRYASASDGIFAVY